ESILVELEVGVFFLNCGVDIARVAETFAADLGTETVERWSEAFGSTKFHGQNVSWDLVLSWRALQERHRRRLMLQISVQKLSRVASHPGVTDHAVFTAIVVWR